MSPLIDRVKKLFYKKMPTGMVPVCKRDYPSPSFMNMSSLHKAVPDIVVDPDPHTH